MSRDMSRRHRLPLLMLAFALSGAGALMSAGATERANSSREAQQARRFTEAEIFVELNDTDEDLGLHASIDGEPWTSLEIEGPNERELLDIFSLGRLRNQAMTQLSFESAEPPFELLDPDDFFRRFPEGRYQIEAVAQGGGTLEGTAVLSHVLAAPPENVLVSGMPAAESCDVTPLPKVFPPVRIQWDPVTTSHPEVGKSGPVKVSRYQFFVEREGVKLSLDLPPTITEFEIPTAVTALGKDFKFEIIVRTTTGNNTAVESCFEMR
jgi:hypothetical protein